MRVVLAGAESGFLDLLIRQKAPNLLMTYYYLRKKGDGGLRELEKAREAGAWLMIDSGAYSWKEKYLWLRTDLVGPDGKVLKADPEGRLQASIDKKREAEGDPSRAVVIDRLSAYFDGYCEWLHKMDAYGFFDAYAELDLDMIVEELIWDWRKTLDQEVSTNAEVIITPHLYQDWSDLIRRGYTYFGLEAGGSDSYYGEFFSSHMAMLKENKIKIHGWAMTNQSAINKHPFYSVDSSSWLAGGQWGLTFEYKGNGRIQMHGMDYKHRRKGMQALAEDAGVDFDAFLADEYNAVNEFSVSQWVRLADDMMSYTLNSYWLDEDEKTAEIVAKREELGMSVPAEVRHDFSSGVRASEQRVRDFGRYCNSCYLNQRCPAFAPAATCSVLDKVDIKDGAGFRDAILSLVEMQVERVAFGVFSERVSGQPMDHNVSKEMASALNMLEKAKGILAPKRSSSVQITAEGPAAGGVIASLFGGYGKAGQGTPGEQYDAEEILDVEAEDEE